MSPTPLIESTDTGSDDGVGGMDQAVPTDGLAITVSFSNGSQLSVKQQELQLALLVMQTVLVAAVVYNQVID